MQNPGPHPAEPESALNKLFGWFACLLTCERAGPKGLPQSRHSRLLAATQRMELMFTQKPVYKCSSQLNLKLFKVGNSGCPSVNEWINQLWSIYAMEGVLSRVWLFAILWTVALQAPLLMEFSRQEYWRGLTFPTLGDLSDPGIIPMSFESPALAGELFTTAPSGKLHTM